MENKLELKHLAPYLPYGIKIKTNHGWEYLESLSSEFINIGNEDFYEFHEIKPYLRPLSNLIKEIEHNGEKFVPIDRIEKEVGLLGTVDYTFEISLKNGDIFDFGAKHYDGDDDAFGLSLLEISNVYDLLNEWHFDWKFGLIEKGLAINL